MAKLLTRCPVCENGLFVSELTCSRCQTRIHGAFDPCRFCRLAPEQLAFLETSLRCEGNLSRVEKELGLSYPTVRNKLTATLTALGFLEGAENGASSAVSAPGLPTDEEKETQRRGVLNALARGDMRAEEAAEALRELL